VGEPAAAQTRAPWYARAVVAAAGAGEGDNVVLHDLGSDGPEGRAALGALADYACLQDEEEVTGMALQNLIERKSLPMSGLFARHVCTAGRSTSVVGGAGVPETRSFGG